MNRLGSVARITELDWLKATALFLLIVVHSDFYIVFPQVIYPVKWFLLSALFFVSGYLAYNSFKKHKESILSFLKAKFWSLYIPFFVAVVFYIILFYIDLGKYTTPLETFTIFLRQIAFLDVFNNENVGFSNWGFLWFIPCLIIYLIIFCLLEKYVKNPKIQVGAVIAIWFLDILTWVFDAPFKTDIRFSQYILVFMFGYFINKLKIYPKIVNLKAAVLAVPVLLLFSFDITSMFNTGNLFGNLGGNIYFSLRSVALGLSVIIISLFLMRKGKLSSNRLIDSIAKLSIIIYLSEAFVSYLLRTLFFGGQLEILLSNMTQFIAYEAVRFVILFLLFPLVYILIKKYGILNKSSRRLRHASDNNPDSKLR
jgi:hypothetical protein